ncbi:MAG: type IV secretion system protein B4 [Rhodospirillaceae bacterium]|jgi:type IV secretion system protein VirB4|nr:type IV secretion system protein B4 [Rhodospirillaceae bacterium]
MSILSQVVGIGSIATIASALAIPASRRLVLGSVIHDWLGNELEFDHIEDMTVICKSGSRVRVYSIGGLAYDTKPELEQIACHQGRVDFIHLIANQNVSLRLFGIKRRFDRAFPAIWPSSTLQEIGDSEVAIFRAGFEVRWYLMMTSKDIRSLEEADEKVFSLLSLYKPTRVIDTKDFAHLTGFLHFLTTGVLREDLNPVSKIVSGNLPCANITVRDDGVLIAHLPTPCFYRFIAIREWPELISGKLIHDIMKLPYEIEISQIAIPSSKEMISLGLKRRLNNPLGANQVIAEAGAAIELLQQGKTSLLTTQLTIIIKGAQEIEVDNVVVKITHILGEARVSYVIETKAAPILWFNRLPDHQSLVRPLHLFAEVIAALWPFESAPSGLPTSQFGDEPVRLFRTGSGQSYSFQFQCQSVHKSLGNFLVVAPSNSGKSTLITHLLGGLTKFEGVGGYIFDSKEGCRWLVETMGGFYQSFDKLALNPLDVDDSPIVRQRLSLLVRLMLGEMAITEGVEDVLAHLCDTTFQIPRDSRTFTEIFPLVFPPHSVFRKVFGRWVVDQKGREGLYSRVLNAPRDSLSSVLAQSYLIGINMNEALEDPYLGPPVVAHIANAIEGLARSGKAKGTVVFIDEAANLLRNPAFRDWCAVMYREYRKFGGAVGMAFQDPGALFKSGIADAVIENSACFFFYPNPQGNTKAYEVFNLNEEQRAFIFGTTQGRKVLLVKRDAATGYEESVILDVDLAPLGEALRFYRSGPDAVRELIKLQTNWGDSWLEHV